MTDSSDTNPSFTKWFNPTAHRLVVEPFVGGHQARGDKNAPTNLWEKTGRQRIVFEPGATVRVARELDGAFHMLNQDGVVVGGLAPQLRRVSSDGTIVEPQLDISLDLPARLRAEAEAKVAAAVETVAQMKLVAKELHAASDTGSGIPTPPTMLAAQPVAPALTPAKK